MSTEVMTLICYKEAKDDMRRGHVVASYGSGHEIITSRDEQEIIDAWGRKLFENQDSIATWEMTLLFDGINYQGLWSKLIGDDDDAYDQADAMNERMCAMCRAAEELCGRLYQEFLASVAKKKVEAAVRRKAEQEATERAALAALKAKYPDA